MLLDETYWRSPWSTPRSDTCAPSCGNRNHKPLHEFHRKIADTVNYQTRANLRIAFAASLIALQSPSLPAVMPLQCKPSRSLSAWDFELFQSST